METVGPASRRLTFAARGPQAAQLLTGLSADQR
jgi:hypothetical protein